MGLARFNMPVTRYGNCLNCDKQILAGEQFVFGRKERANKIWHVPTCPSGAAGIASGLAKIAGVSDVSSPFDKSGMFTNAPLTVSAPLKTGLALKKSGQTATQWEEQLKIFVEAGGRRGMLIGPAGTGKSTAASDGYKFRVTCHEDMGPESLVGTFIQKDGQTVWIDGAAVKAMRLGTRLVLDEIDHVSPECMSLCYALLDDAPSIMLPTGEYVEAEDGYSVIATSNGNPMELPDPIMDRLEFILVADKPSKGAWQRLESPADDISSVLSVMHNHYTAVPATTWDWSGKPTVRRTAAFVKFVRAGVDATLAAKGVFGKAGKELLSAMTTAAR